MNLFISITRFLLAPKNGTIRCGVDGCITVSSVNCSVKSDWWSKFGMADPPLPKFMTLRHEDIYFVNIVAAATVKLTTLLRPVT